MRPRDAGGGFGVVSRTRAPRVPYLFFIPVAVAAVTRKQDLLTLDFHRVRRTKHRAEVAGAGWGRKPKEVSGRAIIWRSSTMN